MEEEVSQGWLPDPQVAPLLSFYGSTLFSLIVLYLLIAAVARGCRLRSSLTLQPYYQCEIAKILECKMCGVQECD
ncbi:hypothetical protein JCGZ_18573 [Jatropha curcas]|uniref:Uncharacterized protein n=1 Tax=Jatropha curcas TaxID=180498 RepID=A0A067KDW3_JATCU|nr:hypothetical protein JCGZ_18573 [Jatropha curcas]